VAAPDLPVPEKWTAEENVLPGWRLMSPGTSGCLRGGAHVCCG
jgi:hypothetical protein